MLLTNISTLHCLRTDLKGGGELRIYRQTDMQTIHTFDCHYDKIVADEFLLQLILGNVTCLKTYLLFASYTSLLT